MTSHTDRVEGRREVRVSANLDQRLAQRIDALAKASNSTRAAVVRAALQKL